MASPRSPSCSVARPSTRTYVERDLREVYAGRLFYGKDAFEGLHVMDRLGAIRRGTESDDEWGTVPSDSTVALRGRFAADDGRAEPVELPTRSPDVATDNPVPRPPFLGSRVVKGIPVDDVAEFLNETAIFRNQWQFRPQDGEDDAAFKERMRPQLREELAKAKSAGLLVPQVVYGYFPANGDGNDLVIWTRRVPQRGAGPLLAAAADQVAVLLHRRLLPAGQWRRARLRRLPHRDDGPCGVGGDSQALR